MTLLDTQKVVSHRARKRARKQFHKSRQTTAPPPVRYKSPADPIPSDEREKRDRERIERQQRIALLMCDRKGVPKQLKFLDYRYWQLRSCFGMEVADDEHSYAWWRALHYETRDSVRKLSRVMRGVLRV